MNPIDAAFRPGRTLLCPFVTAGFPTIDVLPQMLLAIEHAGAGCIEVGIPFSDPVADGPVIQESYYAALSHGLTVDATLNAVRLARSLGLTAPLMAMVSFSIIFKIGTREIARSFADAGFTGLVLPDLPVEEAPAVVSELTAAGLSACLLVAPTTPSPRRAQIIKLCTGFVYYLSVSGITGERSNLPPALAAQIAEVKRLSPRPVCVGFGISSPEHVRALVGKADGVIVGSALIRRIAGAVAKSEDPIAAAAGFIGELSAALTADAPR